MSLRTYEPASTSSSVLGSTGTRFSGPGSLPITVSSPPTTSAPPSRTSPVMRLRFVLLTIFALVPTAGPLSAADGPRTPTFERDIQPILTRAGCNAGACHGKARGQNGFQLSLLAFDHDADYAAL